MHQRLLPLMQVNFVESNPVPVKSAMAAMGLLEEVFRLPMVPPRAGVAREGAGRDARTEAADRGAVGGLSGMPSMPLQPTIETLFAAGAGGRPRRGPRRFHASCSEAAGSR